MPNSWITENMVISQELIHIFFLKKTKKKKGHFAIKLDFVKAHEKMERSFILAT